MVQAAPRACDCSGVRQHADNALQIRKIPLGQTVGGW
jgi:hypothetical protein